MSLDEKIQRRPPTLSFSARRALPLPATPPPRVPAAHSRRRAHRVPRAVISVAESFRGTTTATATEGSRGERTADRERHRRVWYCG